MSEMATRRRDQRRVHRAVDAWYTACAKRLSITWVDADFHGTSPADLCKRCWPTFSTDHRTPSTTPDPTQGDAS